MYSVVCYGTYGMLHKCMSQRWSHHVHEQRSSNTEMFVDDFIPQSPVAAQKKKFIRRAIKRHYSGWRVRTVAPLCSEDSNEGVCVSRGLWRQPCLYVEDPWKLEHIHHVCPSAGLCVWSLLCNCTEDFMRMFRQDLSEVAQQTLTHCAHMRKQWAWKALTDNESREPFVCRAKLIKFSFAIWIQCGPMTGKQLVVFIFWDHQRAPAVLTGSARQGVFIWCGRLVWVEVFLYDVLYFILVVVL